jgi:hypothetical protein
LRRARRAPSSAMLMTGSSSSALDVVDAIAARRFLANASKISAIGVRVKRGFSCNSAPGGRGVGLQKVTFAVKRDK